LDPAPGAARRVSIRVDVDTHTGMRDGVPRLLDLLGRYGVPASFFATMGPDNSGRAIRRVFTRPGFAAKMARTNALKTYGLRTLLSGTLLPSRPVGSGFPQLLKRSEASGHECGVHGWDHVRWHDRLERLAEEEIAWELERAVSAFDAATGHPPAGTVAPAWRATPASLAVQDRLPFRYASDARGTSPFRVAGPGGATHRLMQIPTTLPTLDEMLGGHGMTPEGILAALTRALVPARLNVFTIHTEVEGRHHAALFEEILKRWLAGGWIFETLGAVAARAAADPALPVCRLERGEVPGRAGWVSMQGPVVSTGSAG
jgi:peptidoglycan/xylan/chitin deacetylase (PgdA/CDA1 family)